VTQQNGITAKHRGMDHSSTAPPGTRPPRSVPSCPRPDPLPPCACVSGSSDGHPTLNPAGSTACTAAGYLQPIRGTAQHTSTQAHEHTSRRQERRRAQAGRGVQRSARTAATSGLDAHVSPRIAIEEGGPQSVWPFWHPSERLSPQTLQRMTVRRRSAAEHTERKRAAVGQTGTGVEQSESE
jgi:hypothetical protein